MQVKILIGTVAFMLTMMLLGFYTLLEQSRLARFTGAYDGRLTEKGADLFANNCATCHGKDGKAQQCFDPAGKEISCQGLPLNNYGLVCGAKSQRMESLGWGGSKEAFIRQTIAGGRSGGVMPTWSQDYGGPLQRAQIDALTKFVLNYGDEELCSVQPFVFPWPATLAELPTIVTTSIKLEPGQQFDTAVLPAKVPGDPVRGEELYRKVYNCTSCHLDPTNSAASAGGTGPWHGKYSATAQQRVGQVGKDESGADVTYNTPEDYSYRSILYPGEYLVTKVEATGEKYPNAMPAYSKDAKFNENPQDIADLVAYLLSLK